MIHDRLVLLPYIGCPAATCMHDLLPTERSLLLHKIQPKSDPAMPNFAMRSMILAVCLTAVACTDEQASAPEMPPAGNGSPAVAASEVVAASEASPAPTLTTRTATLDGLSESPLCALDSVNGLHASEGNFTVSATKSIMLEGWVAMTNLQTPDTFSIILDGQSDFDITHVTGINRKDVADAYGSADLENAGFQAALPALEVPADQYSVMISHDEAGAAVVCKTNLRLVVSQ